MKKVEKTEKKPEKKKIFDSNITKKSFEFTEEKLPKNITNKSQITEEIKFEIPDKMEKNLKEFPKEKEISEINMKKNEETDEI